MRPGDVHAELTRRIAERWSARFAFVAGTGRTAMALLLESMATQAPRNRDEVIVPAYTCYSVPASVVRAGLRPRFVDVVPQTLDFDPDALATTNCDRVVAMVATNLYGLPNDLPRWTEFARERGIFLVDDAAQAMGASVGGRPSGRWGDAGLFSFDKGKNVSAIDGGALLTDHPGIAAALETRVDKLDAQHLAASVRDTAKLLTYALFLRPSLYWLPARLLADQLGKTVYDPELPTHRPSRPLAALAATMLRRLDEFTTARRHRAAELRAQLSVMPEVSLVEVTPEAHPAYLRFPLLLDKRERRDAVQAALHRQGIGATGSYPASIRDIPELAQYVADESCSGGRDVASRILTLPTHPYVTERDTIRMVDHLRLALAGHRS
jgi:dTDP-4-amino-4,6-dideoxygalactose transaminase